MVSQGCLDGRGKPTKYATDSRVGGSLHTPVTPSVAPPVTILPLNHDLTNQAGEQAPCLSPRHTTATDHRPLRAKGAPSSMAPEESPEDSVDTYCGNRRLLPIPSWGVGDIGSQEDDRLLEHWRPRRKWVWEAPA